MAGDNGFEIKEFGGGITCASHVHREMAPGGEDADVWTVKIVKDRHIGHHISVARNIYRVALACDHKAAFAADTFGSIRGADGRAVYCMHHGNCNFAQPYGAAFVETDPFNTLCFSSNG